MALSLICIAIRSKSPDVMAPESPEIRDFTESTMSESEASAVPMRGRSIAKPAKRDLREKTIRRIP
jgi:hypothetical protein